MLNGVKELREAHLSGPPPAGENIYAQTTELDTSGGIERKEERKKENNLITKQWSGSEPSDQIRSSQNT